jgi:hypothetical protein
VPRGREALAGLLLAAIGVLFAVGLLEIGVRWMHLVPDRFWEPDPVLGVRLTPGARGWWTQEEREFLVPVEVNHLGLRDRERERAKPPGVFRVLLLGDSFVEAMHVPMEATIGHRLEAALNARGAPRVEVLSAGVSGYGTASEVLFFEHEGKRYAPDVVVLAFYPGNDVKNNSPTLENNLKPVYGTDGVLQRVEGAQARERARGWRGLLGRSKASRYLFKTLLTRQPQLVQMLARHGWLRLDAVQRIPARDGIPVDYGVYAADVTAEWSEAWRRTEQLLSRLKDAVATQGARLAIAVVSTRDLVYPQSWQEVLATYPRMQGVSWDLEAPQRRVSAWCAAHAVPCVLLAPAFRDAALRGGEPLHYHHDGHWTAAGHRLAAEVLVEFLRQQHLVPQGVHDEVH